MKPSTIDITNRENEWVAQGFKTLYIRRKQPNAIIADR